MTAGERLTTSPMLFGYCDRDGRLAAYDASGGARFRFASRRAAEIATAFLEPRSIASAEQDGFSPSELQEAREAGILVSEEECGSSSLWERHGWSRPAYLLFSQMDIPYQEFRDAGDGRGVLTSLRRAAIDEYERAGSYPHPEPLASGIQLDLPPPRAATSRLSALTSRRSVRVFSKSPPTAEQMAGVLHAATRSLRVLAADRASGDPFRLLNSFYSWAHLFVVAQDVQGVRRGVFEYDWMEHCLVEAAAPPSEDALLACLQGQQWVLGTGFAVFIVADMRGYAWLYRHSRAYIHVLIQAGELGQELLMAATDLGLGGWTSPAVHESRTAALLGLSDDDAVDPISVVKLGRPL